MKAENTSDASQNTFETLAQQLLDQANFFDSEQEEIKEIDIKTLDLLN